MHNNIIMMHARNRKLWYTKITVKKVKCAFFISKPRGMDTYLAMLLTKIVCLTSGVYSSTQNNVEKSSVNPTP